mmetsp:Transcript_4040/g.9634  ORF Transcript_4040/g.9634 Transcript_4040/m.9634 type:complete len:176 (+) Transcript_4040:123-650(+)
MPVNSLLSDKPTICFHAAMMVVQNFGFFVMYYGLWGDAPIDAVCDSVRFSVGFMALTCFYVAFMCIAMAYGGYTDDSVLFPLYWFGHLAGGLCYIFCTYAIPAAVFYTEDGTSCTTTVAPIYGARLKAVYFTHAVLFLFYVYNMLSITYFSWAKATFFTPAPTETVSETTPLVKK